MVIIWRIVCARQGGAREEYEGIRAIDNTRKEGIGSIDQMIDDRSELKIC